MTAALFAHLARNSPRSFRAETCSPRSAARRRRPASVLPLLVGLLGVLMACGGAPAPASPPAPADAGDSTPRAQPTIHLPETRSASVTAILFERGALARKSDQVLVTPGSTVTLAVTSDVADDIHVHGYDTIAPTIPGGEARLEFAADRPGRYTAELESRALPLVEFIVESP